MPTAVDHNNFLVNYIEVPAPLSIDSQEKSMALRQLSVTTTPALSPQASLSASSSIHAPQVLLPGPTPIPPPAPPGLDSTPRQSPQLLRKRISSDTLPLPVVQPKTAPIALDPGKKYHNQIPQYLLDVEAEDDLNRSLTASKLISTLPTPPSLPIFLAKSVLNDASPMTDDASVLGIPNHTVLNHIATSSIKNKVLATSATTRYKEKVSDFNRELEGVLMC
jgi:hypothetical protein